MMSYDEVPYPSLVYPETHPAQLATLATLFGLHPPPVSHCRLLELGCGDGTNLIAIAQSLPHIQCLGIDSSSKQIMQGQQVVETLNLSHVTLKQLKFEEINDDLGKFDYIIAHGIYSWIPKAWQDQLLQLCQQHLSPHGIIYMSYNVYPGWHLENVLRDLMMYHLEQLPSDLSSSVLLQQAKGIVQFLAHLRSQGHGAFDLLLQEKSRQFQETPENYLSHDFLEKENHPVYFLHFVEQAKQARLTYVTDIEFRRYLTSAFPPQVAEALEELFQGDFLRKEQYMDFFYNRTLRRSLLCHQEHAVNREVYGEPITFSYISAFLLPHGDHFKTPAEEVITVSHPAVKASLSYLTRLYPQRLFFEELFQYANKVHNLSQEMFAEELLRLYSVEAIELNHCPATFSTTLSHMPLASPLARWQASQGKENLTNLKCEEIPLDPICMAILPYLDGQHSHPMLLKILSQLFKKKPVQAKKVLEEVLTKISKGAFLLA